jgi:hypothetical protein
LDVQVDRVVCSLRADGAPPELVRERLEALVERSLCRGFSSLPDQLYAERMKAGDDSLYRVELERAGREVGWYPGAWDGLLAAGERLVPSSQTGREPEVGESFPTLDDEPSGQFFASAEEAEAWTAFTADDRACDQLARSDPDRYQEWRQWRDKGLHASSLPVQGAGEAGRLRELQEAVRPFLDAFERARFEYVPDDMDIHPWNRLQAVMESQADAQGVGPEGRYSPELVERLLALILDEKAWSRLEAAALELRHGAGEREGDLAALQEIVCRYADAIHGTQYVGSNGLDDVIKTHDRIGRDFTEHVQRAQAACRQGKREGDQGG